MTKPMTCPRCGSEMNHQAEKLVEPRTPEDVDASRALGGILLAVFACPHCGFIASRRNDSDEG